jgi:hypothetical protein
MACNSLLEILKSCSGNLGGIVKFWVNNGDAIDMSSVTTSNGVVTAAALEGTASAFVEYQFNPNTSNYVETGTIDLVNGSTFYSQVITLQLNRREAAKRQSLLLIALGQPGLTTIVKDSNGLYWIFGLDDDKVFLTGNEGGSGTAKADLNGYTLTLTAESATPAYVITEAVVNGLAQAGS